MNAPVTNLKFAPSNHARTQFVRSTRQLMEHAAFAFWEGRDLTGALPDVDLTPLVVAAQSAPPDPQDKLGTRRRYFGGGTIYAWEEHPALNIVAPFTDAKTGEQFTQYFQPAEINADAGGQVRRFAAIPPHLWDTPAMTELIFLLLDATPHALVSRKMPVVFHVHAITLQSDGVVAGVSLPDHLHKDAEPATYVVLLNRTHNTGGGISHIAKPSAADALTNVQDLPESDLIAERTLTEQFEGFGFWDSRIAHDVTPIYSLDGKPASRSAILIDFGNVAL